MNRDKMIEAIAQTIYCSEGSGRLPAPWTCAGDAHEKEWAFLRKEYEKSAAAVLDLCGPEPLVWASSGGHPLDHESHTVPTAYNVRYAYEKGWKWTRLYRDSYGWECNPTAAQAAAQAHATAAHWASTPLGKMVGVV